MEQGVIFPGETSDAPAAPERLSRTDAQAFADQLNRNGRIALGGVVVIGLDAIRERLGERWARRREQVWEAFERILQKRLPPSALFARIGEIDYLVEAGGGPKEAEALAFHLLQDAHLFFLGERRLNAMRVEAVSAFDGNDLSSRRVELGASAAAAIVPEGRSFDPPVIVPAAERWSALSFASATHRLEAAFERQAVVHLATGRRVAIRLRPVVRVDGVVRPEPWVGGDIGQAEIVALDRATMAQVLEPDDLPLIAPFTLSTLSSTRGRATLLSDLGGRMPSKGMMIELVGVDAGTPHGRLLETVSLLTPYCAGVIVQAPSAKPCPPVVNEVRLSGLSVDAEVGVRAQLAPAALIGDCRAHSGAGPLLFAFGLRSASLVAQVHKAGATHASLAARVVGQG